MNREIKITFFAALIFAACFLLFHALYTPKETTSLKIRVGFVYEGDESTPYTSNFIRAQHALEDLFGEAVEIHIKNNVPENRTKSTLRELVDEKCDIIFTNSYGFSDGTKRIAALYPNVEFCQATGINANIEPVLKNYHTFMGEVYEGRYVAGIVAGMKLKQLIDEGSITPEQAKIGYVGAFPYAEVISGYTAFFLGARAIVPSVTMSVLYTNSWSSFSKEKQCAVRLIDEGCVIISQHSDTIGPAVACEETYSSRIVYHVGYNQSMIDVAPTTSLISTRINWTPYIVGAVKAVMNKKNIEKSISGHVHGNDLGAGFALDWVQMMELNTIIAAPGTEEKIADVVKAFKKGRGPDVFKGNYTGVNPYNSKDTYDLNAGYKENQTSSAPTFCYVLDDVITIEE